MGIEKFSAAFEADREVFLEDLKGKTIAIDAFSEMYRMALGIKSQTALTDGQGNSTAHINSLVAFVIKLHRAGVRQIWVFDHISADGAAAADMAPEKAIERERRRAAKMAAAIKQNELFINEDTLAEINGVDNAAIGVDGLSDEKKDMYHRLEKRKWSPSELVLNDFFLVLNSFNIRYIIAPPGFEGEAICSWLTENKIADAVYSGDTDPIAFGATEMLRYETQTKRIMQYTAAGILKQISDAIGRPATTRDIRVAAAHLGCDFAKKTPGVGPKTLFNKKKWEAELTPEQLHAIDHFAKTPNAADIVIVNKEKTEFVNDSRAILQQWLCESKGFNAERINKAWFSQIDKPAIVKKNKTRTTVLKKVTAKRAAKPSKKAAPVVDLSGLVEMDEESASAPPEETMAAAATVDTSVKMSAAEVSIDFDDIGVANDAEEM